MTDPTFNRPLDYEPTSRALLPPLVKWSERIFRIVCMIIVGIILVLFLLVLMLQ